MSLKILWTLTLAAGLTGAGGCKWLDQSRADYHERRAGEEAKKLNFGAAIDESQKASKAEKDVKHDPLPDTHRHAPRRGT